MYERNIVFKRATEYDASDHPDDTVRRRQSGGKRKINKNKTIKTTNNDNRLRARVSGV